MGIDHLAEPPPHRRGFTTRQHSSRDLREERAQGLVRSHPGRYLLGEPRNLGAVFGHCADQEKEGASRRERGQSARGLGRLQIFLDKERTGEGTGAVKALQLPTPIW